METQIPALLEEYHVPGLSIAIVSNGRVAWARGFGVKDSISKAPVDTDTLFEAGSTSKPVFAYAVMKLHERRILDLDTPLTRYVSERWIEDDPRLDQITPRHVLSHTTGFQNWRSEDKPLRIHFAPGSKWQYSGEGFSYLQLVVSHLAGRVSTDSCEKMFDGLTVCATDIDAYLKKSLLKPFGMTASGYVWEETLASRYAAPHDSEGQPITNRPKNTPVLAARYASAGGLVTTPTEYAKFLIEVLDPKPSDEFRLTIAGRNEMIRPQVKASDILSSGLGWVLPNLEKGKLISHDGSNPGFTALVGASVDNKSGYVIMTNGDKGFDVIGKLVNGDTPLALFVRG